VPLRDRPDELREAWGEVLERHPEPTAKNVREVVREKITPGKTPDAPARVSRALDHLEKTLDEHEAELDAVYKRSLAASLRSIADRLDPPPPPTLWGQA
jgi:hypothetical protein